MIQILYWEYGSGKKRERFEQIEFYGSGINYGKGQQRLAQAFQPKNEKIQKHQQSFEALSSSVSDRLWPKFSQLKYFQYS